MKIGDIGKQLDGIRTYGDVGAFAETLAAHYELDDPLWQNLTVPDYLRGIASWLADAPKLRKYRGSGFPEVPTWELVGEILLGGAIYE